MSLCHYFSDDGTTFTIQVKGTFDLHLAQSIPVLYGEFGHHRPKIILDLRGIEYMDCSAIEMLLIMKKSFKGTLKSIRMSHCRPQIKKILQICLKDN